MTAPDIQKKLQGASLFGEGKPGSVKCKVFVTLLTCACVEGIPVIGVWIPGRESIVDIGRFFH
jgi:hypothetical protein